MSQLQDVRGMHENLYQRISNLIFDITFAAVGIIDAVYDEGKRIDVKSAMLNEFGKEVFWYGVELVRTGSPTCIVDVLPAVGDNVLVFSMQNFVPTQQENPTPIKRANFLPYSSATMKAVQICPQSPSEPDVKVKLNEDGLSIEVVPEAKLTCSGAVELTCEDTASITCSGAVELTCEDTASITCSGAVELTCEDTASITCKGDVTLDCDGNVTATAQQFDFNNGALTVMK